MGFYYVLSPGFNKKSTSNHNCNFGIGVPNSRYMGILGRLYNHHPRSSRAIHADLRWRRRGSQAFHPSSHTVSV